MRRWCTCCACITTKSAATAAPWWRGLVWADWDRKNLFILVVIVRWR
jgi:hypothetical protein